MQKSVIEYLERTVSSYPEKVAVQDSEMKITFSELWDALHVKHSRISSREK